MTTRGAKRHLVSLEGPGDPAPDGDGGYTETWAALNPPTLYAEIKPATTRDLERVTAGTVLSMASHLMTMDFHSGVTLETRITFNGRTFNVTGVSNPEERNVETIAVCVEVVA